MNQSESSSHQIVRFSARWRFQHIALMISFIILAATGLALRYDDSWFGRIMITLEGGFEARGIIHRIFAVAVMVLMIYHLYYLIFTDEGHNEIMKLKPHWKDLQKLLQSVKFSFGLNSLSPQYGKYSIVQKIQYFGVVVGLIIMVLTGLILWFESTTMLIIPLWLYQVTVIVHGGEGLIIFLILFLWHMYNVHLSPDEFPMSRVWLDGKMNEKKLQMYHLEEFQEIMEKRKCS